MGEWCDLPPLDPVVDNARNLDHVARSLQLVNPNVRYKTLYNKLGEYVLTFNGEEEAWEGLIADLEEKTGLKFKDVKIKFYFKEDNDK